MVNVWFVRRRKRKRTEYKSRKKMYVPRVYMRWLLILCIGSSLRIYMRVCDCDSVVFVWFTCSLSLASSCWMKYRNIQNSLIKRHSGERERSKNGPLSIWSVKKCTFLHFFLVLLLLLPNSYSFVCVLDCRNEWYTIEVFLLFLFFFFPSSLRFLIQISPHLVLGDSRPTVTI